MESLGEREAAIRQVAHSRGDQPLDCFGRTPRARGRAHLPLCQGGRARVIAGSDCGFATFAGSKEVHPSIVWAKFKSLVDGARLASQQLWGGR